MAGIGAEQLAPGRARAEPEIGDVEVLDVAERVGTERGQRGGALVVAERADVDDDLVREPSDDVVPDRAAGGGAAPRSDPTSAATRRVPLASPTRRLPR